MLTKKVKGKRLKMRGGIAKTKVSRDLRRSGCSSEEK